MGKLYRLVACPFSGSLSTSGVTCPFASSRGSTSPSSPSSPYDSIQEYGALPNFTPLDTLPMPFSVVEDVMSELPRSLHKTWKEESGTRTVVDGTAFLQSVTKGDFSTRTHEILKSIDSLDETEPEDQEVLHALLRDFRFLASAYYGVGPKEPLVFKDDETPKEVEGYKLPYSIAGPLVALCKKLNARPHMNYASYILMNCVKEEKAPLGISEGEIKRPKEMSQDIPGFKVIRQLEGNEAERQFMLVHFEIEHQLKDAIQSGLDIINDGKTVTSDTIDSLTKQLDVILATLRSMSDRSPASDFLGVRHWVASVYVQFQGIEGRDGRVRYFNGASGAQSMIISFMRALMGLELPNTAMRGFLKTLRSNMPDEHLQFIDGIEKTSQLRDVVTKADDSVKLAYAKLGLTVAAFLKSHWYLATTHILEAVKAAARADAKAKGKDPRTVQIDPTQIIATGGSPVVLLLDDLEAVLDTVDRFLQDSFTPSALHRFGLMVGVSSATDTELEVARVRREVKSLVAYVEAQREKYRIVG